jgi:hypothetical protein
MSDEGNGASHDLQALNLNPLSGAALAPSGWEIEKEAPWHLSAAYMYATGARNGEIARAHGKSAQAVSNLFRQPFFQERVTEIMAANRRDVVDLFRAERINTLETLIEMRDDPETPAHVRAICCRELLDRSMGKPVQPIETNEVTHFDNPCAEAEHLEAEVRQLLKDLNFQP